MSVIIGQDYVFVTNNRTDFLTLYQMQKLHAGLVVIVPSVTPTRQKELFAAALEHIDQRELVNTVVEVEYADTQILCTEYQLPTQNQ